MARLLELGCLVLLLVLSIQAQEKPPINIQSKCLGNLMRVDVGPLRGKTLEVAVVANNSAVLLTASLASQCGFRVSINQLGNAKIYASIQNCFAQKVGNGAFSTALMLRLHGNRMGEDELYQVAETCSNTHWASREIICDRGFMEVSVDREALGDYTLPEQATHGSGPQLSDPRRAAERRRKAGSRIAMLVFFTPEETAMEVSEAQRRGYRVGNVATRLLLRGPKSSPEIYAQNVAGVPMNVLKTSVIFEKQWLATQIDLSAACPALEGSVFFTSNWITWFLPRHIDLISSAQLQPMDVHMGVDGQRLTPTEMAARGYSLSVNDDYIIVEIPIGAVGGYSKSHVKDNHYFTCYSIEPMLELLWTESPTQEDTRYKVLLPIVTPLSPRRLELINNTVPEEQMFKVLLGPFSTDVVLVDITFLTEVLPVADCKARGFNFEVMVENDTSKVFALEVPFTDRVVQQMEEAETTLFSLHLTFGLLVLPEYTPFSLTGYVEARVISTSPPSVSGGCDNQNFNIHVKHGSQGSDFEIIVGGHMLTATLAQQYAFSENSTHSSLVVPFTSPSVAFEAIESAFVRTRLDVVLRNPQTTANVEDFSLVCNFHFPLTECFPNGTMTALAVKLESVPSLDPSKLTLKDPSCGPSYSDARCAYFVFTANSCGTTRKFLHNMMLYENEISLPDELEKANSDEAEYELRVSCYYNINKTHAMAFHTRPRRSEPYAENARGELQVTMRLALDNSFSVFHNTEDFPVVKYLQQPLYFEVALARSTNPHMSMELENCWATLNNNKMSQPRWNLIINGCVNPVDPYQVIFHPVWPNARIQYPSHVKRFEVLMFAFAEDEENLNRQLFVHCDVVICDTSNPLDGACKRQCSTQENGMKAQRRAVADQHFIPVSNGPILIN